MTDLMAPLLDASVAAADTIDSESVKLSSLDALPTLVRACACAGGSGGSVSGEEHRGTVHVGGVGGVADGGREYVLPMERNHRRDTGRP